MHEKIVYFSDTGCNMPYARCLATPLHIKPESESVFNILWLRCKQIFYEVT